MDCEAAPDTVVILNSTFKENSESGTIAIAPNAGENMVGSFDNSVCRQKEFVQLYTCTSTMAPFPLHGQSNKMFIILFEASTRPVDSCEFWPSKD